MSLYKGTTLIAGSLPVPPGAMQYKGTCLQANLPTAGQQKGDYWKLSDESGEYKGQCAIWNSTWWDYSSSNINIDNSLSDTSVNPVENKVIKTALDEKATKTELEEKADKTELANYLPTEGGEITGSINLNAAAENGVAINQKTNTSKVGFTGGTNWQNGAGIDLYGKDYSDAEVKGIFDIFANDGVNTVKKLIGKPNGHLLWNNMRVPTVVSTYINATSDINGNLNISSYRPAGTSFPIGFLAVGMSETVRYCFMTGGWYMAFSNSGTVWEAWANATITGTIFWVVL